MSLIPSREYSNSLCIHIRGTLICWDVDNSQLVSVNGYVVYSLNSLSFEDCCVEKIMPKNEPICLYITKSLQSLEILSESQVFEMECLLCVTNYSDHFFHVCEVT